MRIYQSASFRIATVSKRIIVAASSTLVVLGGLVTTAFILQRPQLTHAATPPDTCFVFDSGTSAITDYYDYENNNPANPACPKAVGIPATIGGVTVTAIGPGAFYASSLTAVTLPDSVTTISNAAFSNNQLTSITLPNSVVSVGQVAFASNNLSSLTIPNSVTTIGHAAFDSNQLTSLTIPNSVTTIGNAAFSNNQLTSLTIPNSVTTIGGGAFSDNQLASIIIPNSVTSLGYAFGNNPLNSVTIAAPIIPVGMFSGKGLTTLVLEDGVTTIGMGAFSNNQLTSLTIPNSVTTIGNAAFTKNQLNSVTIEGNPTISGGAFDFNGLDKSTIPSSIAPDSVEYYDYYQSNASFVRLYATNPAFLATNTDALYTNTINSTTYTTSGYLINPASVTVRSVDTNGAEIQASTVHVSDIYADYRLSSNPTNTLTPSSYYRSGITKSFAAPSSSGYVLTSLPTQTPTLASGNNTVTFVYALPVYSVPFATKTIQNYVSSSPILPSALSAPLITNSNLSVENGSGSSCSTISDARLLPATSTLTSAAPSRVTLLGGIDFTLDCTTGASVGIVYSLGEAKDTSLLRVYKSDGTTLTDITDDVTITTTNGMPSISYSLQDGGDYDEDGVANGKIVDPLYIGIVQVTSPSSATLAKTGTNSWLVVCAGLLLFGGGIAMTWKRFLRA